MYGLFVRNTKSFNYRNIDIKLSGNDARERECFLNVDEVNRL